MRLIVSIDNYRHQKYETVSTLKEVDWAEVDCLIFNNSKDNEMETIMNLSKASEKVKKVLYVNEDIHSLYYGLFAGMNADIYDDESLLASEETIDYLVDNYKETGMAIKTASVDVNTISSFAETVAKENVESIAKLIKNGLWLKTLQKSVGNVENAMVRVDEANMNMVEVFHKTSEVVYELQEQGEKLQKEVIKLSEYAHSMEDKYSKGTKNTPFFFSTYPVPNTIPNVLYVRVYSPCKFLISFLTAYQHYVKMQKQVNSKILLAVPKLKQFMAKYDFLPRLDVETVNNLDVGNLGEMMVTFEPKPIVLNAFFDIKTDLHIVVDMMFGENLLAGPKVNGLSAVSSLSDIRRFNLKATETVVPLSGTASNIVIPYLKDYRHAKTESRKKAMYYNYAKENDTGAYSKLDTIIFGRR